MTSPVNNSSTPTTTPVVQNPPLMGIPAEVQTLILFGVSSKDVANCRLICRDFEQIATDNHLWRRLFYRDFPDCHLARTPENFRDAYQCHYTRASNIAQGICSMQTIEGNQKKAEIKRVYPFIFIDGSLYSATDGPNIKVWDLNTTACTNITEGYSTERSSFRTFLSRTDGKLYVYGKLLSASSEETNRIWSLDSTNPSFTLEGYGAPITSLLYHDRKIFAGLSNGTIKIWSLDTNTFAKEDLKSHEGAVKSLFLAEGNLFSVVRTTSDDAIIEWDLKTNTSKKELMMLAKESGLISIPSVVYPNLIIKSPVVYHEGKLFAVVSGRIDAIQIWDLQKGSTQSIRSQRSKRISDIYSFACGDGMLFLADSNQIIRIFDVRTGRFLCAIKNKELEESSWLEYADGKLRVLDSKSSLCTIYNFNIPSTLPNSPFPTLASLSHEAEQQRRALLEFTRADLKALLDILEQKGNIPLAAKDFPFPCPRGAEGMTPFEFIMCWEFDPYMCYQMVQHLESYSEKESFSLKPFLNPAIPLAQKINAIRGEGVTYNFVDSGTEAPPYGPKKQELFSFTIEHLAHVTNMLASRGNVVLSASDLSSFPADFHGCTPLQIIARLTSREFEDVNFIDSLAHTMWVLCGQPKLGEESILEFGKRVFLNTDPSLHQHRVTALRGLIHRLSELGAGGGTELLDDIEEGEGKKTMDSIYEELKSSPKDLSLLDYLQLLGIKDCAKPLSFRKDFIGKKLGLKTYAHLQDLGVDGVNLLLIQEIEAELSQIKDIKVREGSKSLLPNSFVEAYEKVSSLNDVVQRLNEVEQLLLKRCQLLEECGLQNSHFAADIQQLSASLAEMSERLKVLLPERIEQRKFVELEGLGQTTQEILQWLEGTSAIEKRIQTELLRSFLAMPLSQEGDLEKNKADRSAAVAKVFPKK